MIKHPSIGEKWTVGTFENLVFMGQGRDFESNKFFIFRDGNSFFIIEKDEFFSLDLSKELFVNG